MICNFCGSELPDGTKRCDVCGELLTSTDPISDSPVTNADADSRGGSGGENTYYEREVYEVYNGDTYSESYKKPGGGLGTAALTLGIIALVLGAICTLVFSLIGTPLPVMLAFVSIILAIIGLVKAKRAGVSNGRALAAIAFSLVSVAVMIIFILVNIVISGLEGIIGVFAFLDMLDPSNFMME